MKLSNKLTFMKIASPLGMLVNMSPATLSMPTIHKIMILLKSFYNTTEVLQDLVLYIPGETDEVLITEGKSKLIALMM